MAEVIIHNALITSCVEPKYLARKRTPSMSTFGSVTAEKESHFEGLVQRGHLFGYQTCEVFCASIRQLTMMIYFNVKNRLYSKQVSSNGGDRG